MTQSAQTRPDQTAMPAAVRPEDTVLQRLRQVASPAFAERTAVLPLDQILSAIADTVLPRRLTMSLDGHPQAHLDVVRRSVVAFSWHDPDAPTQKNAELSAIGLAQALTQLSARVQSGSALHICRQSRRITASARQCSISALRQALPEPQKASPRLIVERAATHACAVCWQASPDAPLRHDDDTSPYAPALEAALEQSFAGTRRTNTRAISPAQSACLRVIALSCDLSLVIADLGAERAALVLSNEGAERLRCEWGAVLW